MKVLLSVKPEYAQKILDGEKRYEFRKAVPRAVGVKTIVIYATQPLGKVVGEFDIESVLSERPSTLWKMTREFAGISRSFFNAYFKDRETGHAIKVREVRRYTQPLLLSEVLKSGLAPQSFCYLT